MSDHFLQISALLAKIHIQCLTDPFKLESHIEYLMVWSTLAYNRYVLTLLSILVVLVKQYAAEALALAFKILNSLFHMDITYTTDSEVNIPMTMNILGFNLLVSFL